jgi:hypothetical protein
MTMPEPVHEREFPWTIIRRVENYRGTLELCPSTEFPAGQYPYFWDPETAGEPIQIVMRFRRKEEAKEYLGRLGSTPDIELMTRFAERLFR